MSVTAPGRPAADARAPGAMRAGGEQDSTRTVCADPGMRGKCRPCRTYSSCVDASVAIVFAVTMFLGLLSPAAASVMGEDCDWFGSGLSGPERGVSPVYLRCAQGRLDWSYPRGALRVLLRLGGAGHDFRGCVRLGERAAGARLFLEGPRSLAPLFEEDDEEDEGGLAGGESEPRCFKSRDGQAVLFLEAPSGAAPLSRQMMTLFYRLRPLKKDAAAAAVPDHDDDECRPCTAEEMLHLFCTADFVVRGMVEAVRTQPGRAHSQVHVVANAVLRQAAPVFTDVTPHAKGGEPHRWRATLVLPARCGAAHGPGEFLFLGRLQLGQPALVCAPQLHHWAMVRVAALEEGRGKCSLDT